MWFTPLTIPIEIVSHGIDKHEVTQFLMRVSIETRRYLSTCAQDPKHSFCDAGRSLDRVGKSAQCKYF